MKDKRTFTTEVKESLYGIKNQKKCCHKALEYAERFIKDNALIDRSIFKCEECKGAFLRGVFLLVGSVNAPDKSYHLELKVQNEMNSDELCIFIRECGDFDPKAAKRKNCYIVYFKDGNTIFEFLSFIGATKCAFDYLNMILEKQMRNETNRLTNCECANMKKTSDSVKPQTDAIKQLIKFGELEALPDKLQYTARLRMENPQASLAELAAMHEPPITKSCVNHRLEKIISTANNFKD